MLQIGHEITSNQLSSRQIQRYQSEFEQQGFFRLECLLSAKLLQDVQRHFLDFEFEDRKHETVDATEHSVKRNPIVNMLEFLCSERTFCEPIETITKCGTVGYFNGRIYRMQKGHYDAWHQDNDDSYLCAMSINLSPEPYEGGVLQLRRKSSKQILGEFHNVGPGDAIIFNLSKDLEHCLTEVTSSAPKIAFAGWFRSVPYYHQYLDQCLREARGGVSLA